MKKCKKCGKLLRDSYKGNKCENCKGKFAKTIKKSGEATLGVLASVVAIFKFGPKAIVWIKERVIK